MNYYNDNDRHACAWLRELIRDGQIPTGEVDQRSIADVRASDLAGFTQCHFFAGIGGWPLALRLAGCPEDREVWTGSCPCQPFSAAGRNVGVLDSRHLWPAFRGLIAECHPAIVFGEQVASKAGRAWLAGIRSDLEAMGYAVGAADLCAAGVGAPHIRQRLYWVAHAERADSTRHTGKEEGARKSLGVDAGCCGNICGLEHPAGDGRQQRRPESSGLGNANLPRPQRRRFQPNEHTDQQSPWAASELIDCTDGKARRVEPGSFPLAHGVSGRVGLLRGYGNAIVPYLAAQFIQAGEEALTNQPITTP